ncbi:hypothetical protein CI15_05590 [Paraburkholderia monticola]|uniref:Rieske domain-containing protein n=1 Tax=Paraburkholderia monticola TaxID=1399968 RepID=A0A149PXF5_9BURK|nr:SRPBCC family protein [Paraburkholderia monticola]KXU89667.1 hypothetical protein CI15_05590 [Paraburkholderia monticola]
MGFESKLPPRCFSDPAIFAAEQSILFERTWQFACLRTDVRDDKDFVTGKIGSQPYVLQNFRGRLAALHNVCSHRAAPLQPTERGNRGLHCPYHGWVYDPSGVPVGIPHNEAFYPISVEEAKCLAAKSFSHTALGNMVFVSAAPDAALSSQLGEHAGLLASIGNALDDISFRTRIHAACNWKFLMHNGYDDIHAQFVHPLSSLDTRDYIGAEWLSHPFDGSVERIPDGYGNRHALLKVMMTQAAQARNAAIFDGCLANREIAFDHYMHFVLWPNVIITSVQGLWYNIVRYRPTSESSTEIDMWVVPGRQKDGQSRVTPDILYHLALSGLRVFNEDIEAVESSQRGIASVRRHAVLGKREDKIINFDSAYVAAMTRAGIDIGA